MTAATVTRREPPAEVVDALWAELVTEVQRLMQEVEAETGGNTPGSPPTVEERECTAGASPA